MLTACTIIARNYLPYARVLADSFAAHHPGSTFIVLIIDDERRELETDGEPFRCMRLSDIGFSADETGRLAGIYDVTELATAVKPQLLAHLLTDSEHVVYLDPDIKIFDSLDELADLARNHDIVLTPHTTVPLPRDGRRVDSRHVLGSGVYNLGFIGVGSGARPFLEWWGENTKREALVSPEQMMFTDQRWIDFVPAFFRHYLLKDPGYNVAYWNLHGRDLVGRDGRYLVNDYPLRFFHFSGFNYRQPHLLSKHQDDNPRVLLSERPTLARICAEYVQDLHRAGIDKLRDLPYGWERLDNGFRLDSRSRRVYWNALVAHERDGEPEPPNPFAANHAEAFIAWLNEPHPEGPRGFSRYLFSLYQSRVDLRVAFRDIGGADAGAFEAWLHSNGVVEEAIPVELLPSVTAGSATPPVFATPAALRPGINVAGYLSAELGIGEAARLMIQTIEHARIPHSTNTFTRTKSRQQQAFVPRGAGRGEYRSQPGVRKCRPDAPFRPGGRT